jgi:hypothetical protein
MGIILDPEHHVFRHVGGGSIHDGEIDAGAFELTVKDGQLESGLSVNWMEYFGQGTPQETIKPLREMIQKRRKVGKTSVFARLKVSAASKAAALYTPVTIATDDDPDDPSHALISGFAMFNEQVAEELRKVVIDEFPAWS